MSRKPWKKSIEKIYGPHTVGVQVRATETRDGVLVRVGDKSARISVPTGTMQAAAIIDREIKALL